MWSFSQVRTMTHELLGTRPRVSTALSLPKNALCRPCRKLPNTQSALSLFLDELDLIHRDLAGKQASAPLRLKARGAEVRTSLHSLQMNSAISSMKSPCMPSHESDGSSARAPRHTRLHVNLLLV